MNAHQSPNELIIESINFRKAAQVFRAINHKLRQEMLHLLRKNKKMTVTEIYLKFRLEQSVASLHLAILRKAHLVQTEREGRRIYYSVNYKRVEELNQYAQQLNG
jgi:DNA-binding transcriptional ArsR family regulator